MHKNISAISASSEMNKITNRLNEYDFRIKYLFDKGYISKIGFKKVGILKREAQMASEQLQDSKFEPKILLITIEGILNNIEYDLSNIVDELLKNHSVEEICSYYFDLADYRIQRRLEELKIGTPIPDMNFHQLQKTINNKRQEFTKSLLKYGDDKSKIEEASKNFEENVLSLLATK